MGAINIFLGGTGKFIAEDIQDNLDFFGLTMTRPISFDLDSHIRPGIKLDLVSPHVNPTGDVKTLATTWSKSIPARSLGPAESSKNSGSEISAEHDITSNIGDQLSGAVVDAGLFARRAHGLAIFSLMFDPAKAPPGVGAGSQLRKLIDSAINQQAKDGGGPPLINLVTSTAGGTGAGMIVPLALWLKENYKTASLNLVAVLPSAFSNLLKDTPSLDQIAALGRSGTYALMREISFLAQVDTKTSFSERKLPIVKDGLPYRPGQKVFDRVYWFGGRPNATPKDAFEEAAALVRILSFDSTANQLSGMVGNHALQTIGSLTAIEYPKLRYQRGLVSSVLVMAYESLLDPAPTPGGDGAVICRIFDYVSPNSTSELGTWFSEGSKGGPFDVWTGFSTAMIPEFMDQICADIKVKAQIGGFDRVPTGGAITGFMTDPPVYVANITSSLDKLADENQKQLNETIISIRQEEVAAFADWLRETVFDSWLSGDDGSPPESTTKVIKKLEQLEKDAEALEQRFADPVFLPLPPATRITSKINKLKAEFLNPPPVVPKPTASNRILAVLIAAVFGIAAWVFTPGADVLGGKPEYIRIAAFLLTPILAYRILVSVLMKPAITKAMLWPRMRAAEIKLKDAYSEQASDQAGHWLNKELVGTGSKPSPFFGELGDQIRAVLEAVRQLDKVYKGLRAEAQAEAANMGKNPAHVVAEIGEVLLAPGTAALLAKQIIPELHRRLRVEATMTPVFRVNPPRLKLVHVLPGDQGKFPPTTAALNLMTQGIDAADGPGFGQARAQVDEWTDAVWSLTNWKLASKLPANFPDALLAQNGNNQKQATAMLASELNKVAATLPRGPSVEISGAMGSPVLRLAYAGSPAILAEFNAAFNDPNLTPAAHTELNHYVAAGTQVVSSLGEQLLFLDVWAETDGRTWAPHVISNANEISDALYTYYGADAKAIPRSAASETIFTVIPELLAATSLEIGGNPNPLAPAVVARLLGANLEAQGPTYPELFYLMRVNNQLVTEKMGALANKDHVFYAQTRGEDRMPLAKYPTGNFHDPLFGEGRSVIIEFDAFIEFMRYDGKTFIDGAVAPGRAGPIVSVYPTAELFQQDWATNLIKVRDMQRAIVNAWYEVDVNAVDSVSQKMLKQLEADLLLMSGGDADVRSSWQRAMEKLLGNSDRLDMWRKFGTGAIDVSTVDSESQERLEQGNEDRRLN